jgi:hypothetical protein
LSKEWVTRVEHALKALNQLKTATRRDRLDVITDLFRIIDMLNRSVHGWQHWLQDMSFMASFTEDELTAIKTRLIDLTEGFLRYDLEASQQYPQSLRDQPTDEPTEDPGNSTNDDATGLYV